MCSEREKRGKLLAERVIRGLETRNMEGYYASTREEALKIALDLIPEGSTVGWGGSTSLTDIGLKQAVCEGNYTVLNRDICKSPEEKHEVEVKCMGSDYFLASTNAVTEDGMLLNIDGNANRIAAISFGPKNVILVVGINKIVKNEGAGMYRMRYEAAPILAQRFPVDTPCKKAGVCTDCLVSDCICNQILITRFSKFKGRIKVIIVNDTLGI